MVQVQRLTLTFHRNDTVNPQTCMVSKHRTQSHIQAVVNIIYIQTLHSAKFIQHQMTGRQWIGEDVEVVLT